MASVSMHRSAAKGLSVHPTFCLCSVHGYSAPAGSRGLRGNRAAHGGAGGAGRVRREAAPSTRRRKRRSRQGARRPARPSGLGDQPPAGADCAVSISLGTCRRSGIATNFTRRARSMTPVCAGTLSRCGARSAIDAAASTLTPCGGCLSNGAGTTSSLRSPSDSGAYAARSPAGGSPARWSRSSTIRRTITRCLDRTNGRGGPRSSAGGRSPATRRYFLPPLPWLGGFRGAAVPWLVVG